MSLEKLRSEKNHIHTMLEGVDISHKKQKRRNSTGTLFVDTTLSAQDNDATIKCVCAVIRSHIIQSNTNKQSTLIPIEYEIFRDNNISLHFISPIPTLTTIETYFSGIFKKSQLENECIIIALIYCERLMAITRDKGVPLRVNQDNWKSM